MRLRKECKHGRFDHHYGENPARPGPMCPGGEFLTEPWVIEFDYRSDGGPRLVGPFPTKEAALHWLSGLHIDSEANAARLVTLSALQETDGQ